MHEFRDQDLTGALFKRVNLSQSSFEKVSFNGASMRALDLSGVDIRGVMFQGATLRGVELVDVEVSGEVRNVVVNGVDIAPLIDAELNRQDPDRATMRPSEPDGYRRAWHVLERRWASTLQRAQRLSEQDLHTGVNGEWSFIQTLRHLNFASAAWVGRMVLGQASPWHPLDLPWDEAPGWEGIPWDRDARPSLAEVLDVRAQRQAMVRGVMEALTPAQLAARVSRTEPGWPQVEDFPLAECLKIVLNEEWEHRRYAERDLDQLEKES